MTAIPRPQAYGEADGREYLEPLALKGPMDPINVHCLRPHLVIVHALLCETTLDSRPKSTRPYTQRLSGKLRPKSFFGFICARSISLCTYTQLENATPGFRFCARSQVGQRSQEGPKSTRPQLVLCICGRSLLLWLRKGWHP